MLSGLAATSWLGVLGGFVRLFRKRWSIERLFGRVKQWLLLDGLRVRGLAQVFDPRLIESDLDACGRSVSCKGRVSWSG